SLDKDDSGSASIDELDPRSAEVLAHFKVWVHSQFGGVREAFNAIDSDHTRFITNAEFTAALQRFGFQRPTKQLFSHLDKDGSSRIVIDDLLFLDSWSPLPFLLVAPNFKAMAEIKKLILVRTGQYMKAWRRLLDKDATNRCNWYEFKDACHVLGYQGDIAGAWRAFDDDLSGYISLRQIDEESDMVLSNFRRWCVSEFGSVKSAFAVFDSDCSGSLSFHEFRAACRVYGYDGSARTLFSALDVDQQGTLTLKEISFLDDWEIQAAENDLGESHRAGFGPSSKAGHGSGVHSLISNLKDHPVRARRVARRKYELRQRAVPEIPRLRLSRTGDGEYSWSMADPWQSRSASARPWMPSQDRSPSVKSPTFDPDFIGADMDQDLTLSEMSTHGFSLGPVPSMDSAIASLVERVGLPSTSPSVYEGLVLSESVAQRAKFSDAKRPRTQPNPKVPRILSRLEGLAAAKPGLDELLSNPRVGPPLQGLSRKAQVVMIGSSFAKSKAYYM
ncbi:unnamed protein product, partial [Symbiodinium pilosum]